MCSSQLLQEHHRFLIAIKNFSSCTHLADVGGEEFTERLRMAKPSLQGTTQPQTVRSLPPSPPAARLLTAGLQPRAPHQWHPRDPPMEDLVPTFLLSHQPGCPQDLPRHAKPLPVSLCKGGHGFPCSLHNLAPTHLPPTSGHLPSGQLGHLAGRRAIRVPILGQHHVNAEGWGGEVQSVSCGSFKLRPKKK